MLTKVLYGARTVSRLGSWFGASKTRFENINEASNSSAVDRISVTFCSYIFFVFDKVSFFCDRFMSYNPYLMHWKGSVPCLRPFLGTPYLILVLASGLTRCMPTDICQL